MVFYSATRYEGIDSETDLEFNTIGNICTFLQWNIQDPVSETEINRNNLVFQYQNNRNPFIDDATFADKIWAEKCK
jgi:endonuclease I